MPWNIYINGFLLSSYQCCFVPSALLGYSTCIADWGSVKPPPLAMTCFQLVTLLLLLFIVIILCLYPMKKSFEVPIRRFCSVLAPVGHLLPAFDGVKFVIWLQNMNVGSWSDTVITPSFPTSFWDASLNPKLNLGWRFFPPKYLLANVCEFAGKYQPLASQDCPPCSQKHECLSRGAGMSVRP